MVSVTSASHNQSRSLMYIRGLIPRNWPRQFFLKGCCVFRVNAVTFVITGNPDPLVFHAPQFFFECLQQRISTGNKKKRLPNFTTVFMRKDALPLGTFTKYTWHITNILHVKQIFDTQEVSATLKEVAGLRGTIGSVSDWLSIRL